MMFCISWEANAQSTEMGSRIQAMNKEMDPEKNVTSMHDIIRDYKLDDIKNAEDIDVLKGTTALSFLNAGAFPKFETYIDLIKNKFNQTSYLNMAADILYKDTARLNYAEIVAKRTVDLYDSYKDDQSARPADFPLDAWNRFVKMAAYPYYETYAKILHAKEKDKAAFFYEEKALKGVEPEEMEQSSVELYTALLETEHQYDKAYDILLKMAKLGKSNANMDDRLKRLYIKRTGSETDASLFLDSIQKNVSNAYRVELIKKMIVDREAPDFSLLNLDGKRVSLVDLRGKVVVLDFWATWCTPCIASMPAMKMLSSQHPEVDFLFIATREPGTDAEARVRSYVRNNKFPVNVLIDRSTSKDSKTVSVADAYKLTGIPAKIIIDSHGKLRFLTVGYSSDKELINEMEAMIAIAKMQ